MTEEITDKEALIHRAIKEGELKITLKGTGPADRFRGSLYYHRNRASLKDPRAMQVKIKLSKRTVTLTYAPILAEIS